MVKTAPATVHENGVPSKRKRSGSAKCRRRKSKGGPTNARDETGPGRPGAVRRDATDRGGSSGGADPSPFGKRLAHSDKKVRDKALKNLASWLQHKDLNRLEWLKLWKGLFYCFWMSDKPLVQQQLAADLAALSCRLKKENVWEYVCYFWETLCREWPTIDRLRLDKFYLLMRKFLRQSFIILAEASWANDEICRFVGIMSRIPLSPDSPEVPDGIRYQTADIFIEELENTVPLENLPSVPSAGLLEPFISLLALTMNKTVVARVRESVFEAAVKRSALAAEDGRAPAYDIRALATAVLLRAADESTPPANRRRMEKLVNDVLKTS